MNKQEQKVFIASKGFSSNSLVTVTAYVGFGNYLKDMIWINFRPGAEDSGRITRYDETREVSMLLKSIDLRALSYAMKERLKTKEVDSGYVKYTGSGNEKKMLTIGFVSKEKNNITEETYYMNFYLNKKQIGNVSFSKWEFAAFSDILTEIAQRIELAINKYQKAMLDQKAKQEIQRG